MLANVSPSAKEATKGAMRARTEVGGVCFTYMACPCVRCVATESPHAGFASCIAPVVAVVAPADSLLYFLIRPKVDIQKSQIFDTFNAKR